MGTPFTTEAKDLVKMNRDLPAPRPLQRARDAATRLFGYHSRPVSPQHSPVEGDGFFPVGRARRANLGATQNVTVSHQTGREINALAINNTGSHALLAGREIFKTIRIEDGVCTEEWNLRSVIRSNAAQTSGTRPLDSIDIADVAWAKGDCGDYVAAATSSGKILLYDLGHAGLPAAKVGLHLDMLVKGADAVLVP